MNQMEMDMPVTPTEITVEMMEKRCERIQELRLKCSELSAQRKVLDDELAMEEGIALEWLRQLGKRNYHARVGTLGISQRMRVRLPQSPEDKAKFFEYLKRQGVFEDMATVNYQTLNGFYSREYEAAVARGEGMEFSIPGIEPAVHEEIITFSKSRN